MDLILQIVISLKSKATLCEELIGTRDEIDSNLDLIDLKNQRVWPRDLDVPLTLPLSTTSWCNLVLLLAVFLCVLTSFLEILPAACKVKGTHVRWRAAISRNSDKDILLLPFPCSLALILLANSLKNQYQILLHHV